MLLKWRILILINNNDVQLFFANNEEGNIAIIYDLKEEDRNSLFTCPVCASEVKPICIDFKKKSGEYSKISPHFSHFDSSKCDSETRIHFWTKTKFLTTGDKFTINSDVTKEYTCVEVLIEKTYSVGEKTYTSDITIITECGATIFFELNYTNKKKIKDYLEIWEQLGNIVVEVDIKTLINVSREKNYIFEALYYNGKCFDKSKNNLYNQTIGKYKEKIDEKNCSDETKKKLQNLNWFWKEVVRYKKGEADVEFLTNLIDYNDKEEKDIIFDILSRKTCVNMYEDYMNYKARTLYKIAKDYLDICESGINNYFTIVEQKKGRKYKNIPINQISIRSKYDNSFNIPLEFTYNVALTSTNSFTNEIDTIISIFKENKLYYDKSILICSIIIEKYKDMLNDLYVNSEYSKYHKSIRNLELHQISGWWSSYLRRFFIFKDKISTDNEEELVINLLDDNNINQIVSFISKYIDEAIELHKQKLIRKEAEDKIELEKKKLELKKKKENFRKVLNKVAQCFELNKEKILSYDSKFVLDESFDNLLYFKDYKGNDYIVYSGDNDIHHNDRVLTPSLYSEYKFLKLFNHNDLLDSENIYIVEYDKHYTIVDDIGVNSKYLFQNYLSENKVNLSFREFNGKNIYLPRYDFVKITANVNKVIKDIYRLNQSSSEILKQDIKINYNQKVIEEERLMQEITNDEFNKEIYRLMYPLIYQTKKSIGAEVNIVLNVDFTEKKPWLIKDFIEALNKIGIGNVYNRI